MRIMYDSVNDTGILGKKENPGAPIRSRGVLLSGFEPNPLRLLLSILYISFRLSLSRFRGYKTTCHRSIKVTNPTRVFL